MEPPSANTWGWGSISGAGQFVILAEELRRSVCGVLCANGMARTTARTTLQFPEGMTKAAGKNIWSLQYWTFDIQPQGGLMLVEHAIFSLFKPQRGEILDFNKQVSSRWDYKKG